MLDQVQDMHDSMTQYDVVQYACKVGKPKGPEGSKNACIKDVVLS